MTNLVPPEDIERIVGMRRRAVDHLGRAVSAEEMLYILHSRACKESGIDLRECPFSVALDEGIDPDEFTPDAPLILGVDGKGYLYQELAYLTTEDALTTRGKEGESGGS